MLKLGLFFCLVLGFFALCATVKIRLFQASKSINKSWFYLSLGVV